MNDSPTSERSTRYDFGLDKITITTLVAGAVNVIGGVTAVRGWLLDVGTRYFDSLGFIFGFPRGVFIPSEERILQTGYVMFTEAMGPWVALSLFISVIILVNILVLFATRNKLSSATRSQLADETMKSDIKRKSSPTWRLAVACCLITVYFLGFGYFAYKTVYKVPDYANGKASEIARAIDDGIKDPNCPRCKLFGKKKIKGIAIFADEKTIFIATSSGGLARIPLDGIEISPVIK